MAVCGTSLFVADAFAQLREGRGGHGETGRVETTGAWTEAHPASEYRHGPVSATTSRVRVHLQAEVEAAHRGRDVDNPPLLSRSVILS